jgi:uroporphyrinogen-III synthase
MSPAGEQVPCDLGGQGVLVTRPAAQAEGLCRLIEEANGRPLAIPASRSRRRPIPGKLRPFLPSPGT